MDFNELLGNPAVQGALVPFVVALIAAGLLRSTRLTGLAVALGVCCTVYLTIGWSFESMSATRKLSILVLVTALLVLLIEWFQPARRLLAAFVRPARHIDDVPTAAAQILSKADDVRNRRVVAAGRKERPPVLRLDMVDTM